MLDFVSRLANRGAMLTAALVIGLLIALVYERNLLGALQYVTAFAFYLAVMVAAMPLPAVVHKRGGYHAMNWLALVFALLYAAKAIEKLKPANDDQRVGIDIVRKALATPAKQIVVNAGADGSIVVGKLMERGDFEWGYDAQTDQYVNMYKAGIVDPAKVVRTALQDAASVAGLIITTEAAVAERPKKESAGGPGGMPGGMGGMGDMDY